MEHNFELCIYTTKVKYFDNVINCIISLYIFNVFKYLTILYIYIL